MQIVLHLFAIMYEQFNHNKGINYYFKKLVREACFTIILPSIYTTAVEHGDCIYVLLPNKPGEQPHTVNKVKISERRERIKCTLGLKKKKKFKTWSHI